MTNSTAAKRYAKAVFSLARESDKLDQVREDLQALETLLEQSVELQQFLLNPLVTLERRAKILKALFGHKLDPLSVRFLLFLDDKGRIDELAGICGCFEAAYYELKGILKVKMRAAKAPESEQIREILQRLGKRYDKEIELDVEIEPALLGGFQLQIGDMVHDSSIRTKLLTFQQQLINA